MHQCLDECTREVLEMPAIRRLHPPTLGPHTAGAPPTGDDEGEHARHARTPTAGWQLCCRSAIAAMIVAISAAHDKSTWIGA